MSERKAFTLVELLTVLAIIALLSGILLPSIAMVRKQAKETAQKAQFGAIDMALDAFKQDYGDYPPSNSKDAVLYTPPYYCGAQKLTEALLGWDLRGFHPQSSWLNVSGAVLYNDSTLFDRRGPYLEVARTNVYRLGTSVAGVNDGLYDMNKSYFTNNFDGSVANFVICDVFSVKKITITTTLPSGGTSTTTKMAGSPILYYKANTASKWFDLDSPADNIYNHLDNQNLLYLGKLPGGYDGSLPDPNPTSHRLAGVSALGDTFYDPTYKIVDQKVPPTPSGSYWPNRPDSYILISAGADHEFGTKDDILNF